MNKTKLQLIFLIILIFATIRLSYSQNDTVLLDIGSIVSLLPWNNLVGATNGQVANLMNSQGHPTGISVEVSDPFNSTNTSGTTSPDTSIGFPATATEDSFFGNVVTFSNKTEPTGALLFSGLNPQKKYAFEIFASRMASDNRQTRYILSGQTIDTLYLNPSSNSSVIASDSLFPSGSGTITLLAEPGPANNNSYGFYYLGAVKLIYEHEPLIGPASLQVLSPNGGEYWQVGKTPSIIWESTNIGQVYLSYSLNMGNTWHAIDTVPAYLKAYPWTIPNVPSQSCLVRISSDTLFDTSDNFFQITDDTLSCPIVVLGSSTAFGAGASVLDSSWVALFRNHMFQKNTAFSTYNLARGGYTSFHILPTGTVLPPGVSIQIDTARNITKALSYNPVAIIINMPSNDAAHNFDVTMQMNNFNDLYNLANNLGIATWICTSQPRNFSNPAMIQIQEDVRDAILAQFGAHAIDFWNGLADTNGFILGAYDSGDGIHLNNAGHKLLFERMLLKSPDTVACGQGISTFQENNTRGDLPDIFPNPANDKIYIRFSNESENPFYMTFYNTIGQSVRRYELRDVFNEIDVSALSQGAYIYTFTDKRNLHGSGLHFIFR